MVEFRLQISGFRCQRSELKGLFALWLAFPVLEMQSRICLVSSLRCVGSHVKAAYFMLKHAAWDFWAKQPSADLASLCMSGPSALCWLSPCWFPWCVSCRALWWVCDVAVTGRNHPRDVHLQTART